MSHDGHQSDVVRQIRDAAQLPSIEHVIARHLDLILDAHAQLAPQFAQVRGVRQAGRSRRHGLVLVAAAAAILLVPTLAFAGGLPDPLQRLAVQLGDAVGVSIPRSGADAGHAPRNAPPSPDDDALLDATRTEGLEEDSAEPGIRLVLTDGDTASGLPGGSSAPRPTPPGEHAAPDDPRDAQAPEAEPGGLDPSETSKDQAGSPELDGAGGDSDRAADADEPRPELPANPRQEKPKPERPKVDTAPGEDASRGAPNGTADATEDAAGAEADDGIADPSGSTAPVRPITPAPAAPATGRGGSGAAGRIAAPIKPPGRAPA